MNSEGEIWDTPLLRMLETLDSYDGPWQMLEKLKKFDNLPQEQFDELTSGKYIKSDEAAIVMQYLPVERLMTKIPLLLTHLMDGNWPASGRVCRLLTFIGAPVVEEIRKVFQTDKNDGIWLNTIIRGVISGWDNSLILNLKAELIEIVGYAEYEGASVSALEILERVLPTHEFEQLYNFLQEKYIDSSDMTRDLLYTFNR